MLVCKQSDVTFDRNVLYVIGQLYQSGPRPLLWTSNNVPHFRVIKIRTNN